MALTKKQSIFIDEYMTNGFNATQAAIKAGYSEATARSQGQRLLTNVDVKEEIKKRCQDIVAEYPLLRKRIMERLQKIAFSDIKDFLSFKTEKTVVDYDKDTGDPIINYRTFIELKDSDKVDGGILSEVTETREGFKFKRSDPLKALEMLGKYTGLDNVELEDLKEQIQDIKDMIRGITNEKK